MLADTKVYVMRYDRCQRHAPIVRQPLEAYINQHTHPFCNVGNGNTWTISYGIETEEVHYEFREYCDDNSIKLRFTSVAHPQENGQAKVANRIILDGLKKRVEHSRNTWVDELLPILWAYQTTCKVTIEATPFMLAYGAEAVLPLEITHGSPRIEAYELDTNEEGMRHALDLIDEVKDEANARNVEHQRRASLYYNRRVAVSTPGSGVDVTNNNTNNHNSI
ncbi:uncharacterized protein LOC141665626 [Apium graveolens]|uniref:uncharacterized protein LOC141665626 n=1 Tax=Apium graveolens TaxID=4045 RepID=UPI003D7B21AE